jgi:hypothetical protein
MVDTGYVTEVAVAPTWVCVQCRARVPMAADSCNACGRPFAAGLVPDSPTVRADRARWVLVVRELVILNVLFVIWRIVGQASLFHAAGAFGRGRWIWAVERALHLPSEAALQHAVLGHTAVSRVCNGYYAYGHAPTLAVVLLWLLWRHRDQYARWRNLVVGFTGVALVIGLLPVAPPRLVPGLHVVDLASRYHQSVYSSLGSGISDQLSALPSVHVGWAIIVAAAVIIVSTSRWRWLTVAHPVITLYVVVVTANHYWLDAVAAIAVLTGVYAMLRRYRPRLVP